MRPLKEGGRKKGRRKHLRVSVPPTHGEALPSTNCLQSKECSEIGQLGGKRCAEARGAEQTGPPPLSPHLRPWAPDCFFQLGNLTFAEADYRQALELSPQDEGANLRMGLLQEKMGFCEQKSRCAGGERGGAGAGRGRGGAGPGRGRGRGRGPTWPEAECWDPWVKMPELSQLCFLNTDFIFQVFAKIPSHFS